MLLPLLVLAACHPAGQGEPRPDATPPTPPGGGWSLGAPELPAGCEGAHAGRAPLRRLTNAQIAQAIEALLPNTNLPTLTLPPDTVVDGFENDADAQTPSALYVADLETLAYDVAAAAMEDGSFLGCTADGGADPTACGHAFVADFGRRAFRRPLDAEQLATWNGWFDALLAEEDFGTAVELTLVAMFQSPEFLYLLEDGTVEATRVKLDGWSVAARLALFLWGTLPDDTLLDAADAGTLDTVDGVEVEARRMLADPRARDGLLELHRQWLDLDAIADIERDIDTYPQFSPALQRAMRTEIEAMILAQELDGPGTLTALLTTRTTAIDRTLARVYGVEIDEVWDPIELDPTQRAGFLTTPGWLALTSHEVNPSPVLRGKFVLERLVCYDTPPPPVSANTAVPEDTGAPVTNRERYAAHTADPGCSGCHAGLDGIGFGFESFDAEGAWRDTDNGLPVDDAGELHHTDVDGAFAGAVELAERLAASETVHDCVASQWTRYALGRTLDADDTCALDAVQAGFREDDDLRELLVRIARSDALRYRVLE